MSKADPKHTEVKRFIGVRALVTTLMLVVDYVIPPGKNEAFVFDAWMKWIQSRWPIALREQVMRWANQHRTQERIKLRELVTRPECLDQLPFVPSKDGIFIGDKFTARDIANAVDVLRRNNIPPADDGHYYMQIDPGQAATKVREYLEQEVLNAVSGLPNFARSVLRGAWSILEGHGPEFDDTRIQLVGMAFDLANGNKGVDARDLCKYAYHVLDMRLAPMPPKLDNEMAGLVQLTDKPPSSLTQTQKEIADECGRIARMLIEKNRAYGDSALDPVRMFSQADAIEQLKVRIDDKLSRLKRGSAAGEDVIGDLLGYLVLLKIAMRRQGQASETPANNRSDRSERCTVKS